MDRRGGHAGEDPCGVQKRFGHLLPANGRLLHSPQSVGVLPVRLQLADRNEQLCPAHSPVSFSIASQTAAHFRIGLYVRRGSRGQPSPHQLQSQCLFQDIRVVRTGPSRPTPHPLSTDWRFSSSRSRMRPERRLVGVTRSPPPPRSRPHRQREDRARMSQYVATARAGSTSTAWRAVAASSPIARPTPRRGRR